VCFCNRQNRKFRKNLKTGPWSRLMMTRTTQSDSSRKSVQQQPSSFQVSALRTLPVPLNDPPAAPIFSLCPATDILILILLFTETLQSNTLILYSPYPFQTSATTANNSLGNQYDPLKLVSTSVDSSKLVYLVTSFH
jgi:hypothetical protein